MLQGWKKKAVLYSHRSIDVVLSRMLKIAEISEMFDDTTEGFRKRYAGTYMGDTKHKNDIQGEGY